MNPLRQLPGVDVLLRELGRRHADLPRPLRVATIREVLSSLRRSDQVPSREEILRQISLALDHLEQARLQPILNATGVLLHTNLGRAPLGRPVLNTLQAHAQAYNNLELDLATGKRGRRGAYLESCLALLCQAQAATVVNNCAAALILVLRHFTARKPEVLISRGELIQIGGGFRIPEILEAGGGRLREVGTTNQTTLQDYERAIGSESALLLKVHRSNFFMDGFVASPERAELADLARRKRLPLVEDLGSGSLAPTERVEGLDHEPTPAECLRQGVHLVLFSGDKLMGAPQAGIVAGRRRWIAALKKEPLFRALRCDKLVMSGLQTVAEAYLSAETGRPDVPGLPLQALLAASVTSLEERANRIARKLEDLPADVSVVQSHARMGGGTQPRSKVPSRAVALRPHALSLEALAQRLRSGQPPVLGHRTGGSLQLDLRTVFPEQDASLMEAVRAALRS